MSDTIVIVGAGQAGSQLAVSLRTEGFAGKIILIGAETQPPYQRPPLSKHFLAGDVGLERVYVKPAEFYQESAIELRLGQQVTALDRVAKTISLADGSELNYDKLALATGSKVRRLDLPGSDLANICYLRTLDDMYAIQEKMQTGAKLVSVGGGYIGLEVASVAIKKGMQVTVLEAADQLMARVVGPEVAAFYQQTHTAAGVDIRTSMGVTGFAGDGQVESVRCVNGSEFTADMVVVGVGIMPETTVAEAAGLEVANGIVVDETTLTSDPNIVALGDCCNHPSTRYERRVRLESVPNALGQARVAAATLTGKPKSYAEVPWFWSDQYDLKLQMAGFRDGHDQVIVRGDTTAAPFMVCYLQKDELLAVESVNNPREFMVCRQLIPKRAKIDTEKLADASINMKEIAESVA